MQQHFTPFVYSSRQSSSAHKRQKTELDGKSSLNYYYQTMFQLILVTVLLLSLCSLIQDKKKQPKPLVC